MAAKIGTDLSHGTMLAIGIVLLWFAGLCYFFAFLGGKTAALTSGTGSDGKTSGPRDLSGVVARVAENVQAMESNTGSSGTNSGGAGVSA